MSWNALFVIAAVAAIVVLLGSGALFVQAFCRKKGLAADITATDYLPNFARGHQDRFACDLAWWLEQPFEHMTMTSADGLPLHGRYLPGGSGAPTAVLAHGYNGYPAEHCVMARIFHERLGFSLFLPEHRAHGMSGGSVTAFGGNESADLRQWLDLLLIAHPGAKIVLYGHSMGGATVLTATGEKLPEGVICAVSDCAFADLTSQMRYVFKRMFRLLPAGPFLCVVSLIFKAATGKFFSQVSALEAVKASSTPTLFIHGLKDALVPVEMALKLYEAAKCQKELMLVPEAAHAASLLTEPDLYADKIQAWVKKYGA